MSRAPSKAPSQRQLRVAEEIRYALAMTIERGDVHDAVLQQHPLTITQVRVSPDLKNATAFFTPLGGGEAAPLLDALKRATPFLRHELARRVNMKFVPRLSFQTDTSFDEYSHIEELLHRPEVLRDTGAGYTPDDAEDDDTDEDDDDDDAADGTNRLKD